MGNLNTKQAQTPKIQKHLNSGLLLVLILNGASFNFQTFWMSFKMFLVRFSDAIVVYMSPVSPIFHIESTVNS